MDTERLRPVVSIKNIEFSSINFVYQKITNHPEYTAEKYLSEAESKIHPLLITPALSQNLSENISQTKEQDYFNQPQKAVRIDKTLIYIIASIRVFLLVPGFYVPESVKEEHFYKSPTFDVNMGHLS